MIESAGASLGSSGGGPGGGGTGQLPSGGERTARIKELELAMNKRMLKHSNSLVGGSGSNGGTGGGNRGVGSSTSATAAGLERQGRLDMEAKMEVVGDNLDRRASLEELTNQGIFQVGGARARVRCVCGIG